MTQPGPRAANALLDSARRSFHERLLETVLWLAPKQKKRKSGKVGRRKVQTSTVWAATNADADQKTSIGLAADVLDQLTTTPARKKAIEGQSAGDRFEEACEAFLRDTFLLLGHLRPGHFGLEICKRQSALVLAGFEQYAHLRDLDLAGKKDEALAAILGNDYTVSPDIVVFREPEPDEEINRPFPIVSDSVCLMSSLRKSNGGLRLLHASVSCKWTLRSDRVQNARTEALNLIRNRKGRLPHVVVLTAEPSPARLSAIALGTGDIDCVYHFALPELIRAVERSGNDEAALSLRIMLQGKRLRDISDLPLDLAI